jgi:hypothetical protein
MRSRIILVLLLLWSADAYGAQPKTFRQTWANINYVACEGLGLTASGKIDLTINYWPAGWNGVSFGLIPSVYLNTSYVHEHDPTASLSFTDGAGARKTVSLVKPWYATVSSPGSHQLILPQEVWHSNVIPRPPFPLQQQTQSFKAGTPIKLNVTVRFPQSAGNCLGSFSQSINLN